MHQTCCSLLFPVVPNQAGSGTDRPSGGMGTGGGATGSYGGRRETDTSMQEFHPTISDRGLAGAAAVAGLVPLPAGVFV